MTIPLQRIILQYYNIYIGFLAAQTTPCCSRMQSFRRIEIFYGLISPITKPQRPSQTLLDLSLPVTEEAQWRCGTIDPPTAVRRSSADGSVTTLHNVLQVFWQNEGCLAITECMKPLNSVVVRRILAEGRFVRAVNYLGIHAAMYTRMPNCEPGFFPINR